MLLAARDDAGAPLSERQIRDEVVTMFLAGHETAASSLTWALYLLAAHPPVAERLAAALDGDAGGAGEREIDRVMREALRLYPPAYRISRTAVQACKLGGHPVKPGVEIMIPQWAVHRSARFYDEPDAFRPERWTPAFTAALPRFAYFPFGGGPRTCIGNSFAEIEGSVALGHICRRYELRVPPRARVAPYLGVTLLPRDNVLELEVRRRRATRPSSEMAAAPPSPHG
jgi:cytochrome P450